MAESAQLLRFIMWTLFNQQPGQPPVGRRDPLPGRMLGVGIGSDAQDLLGPVQVAAVGQQPGSRRAAPSSPASARARRQLLLAG